MDPADLYQQTFRLEADELLGEIEAVILLVEENPEDAVTRSIACSGRCTR